MDIRMVVGLNVQRLRRRCEISQEELSLRSGCTRGYLSGIETGRRNPTVMFLARLARVLESDIQEFFVKPPRNKAGEKVQAGRKPSSK